MPTKSSGAARIIAYLNDPLAVRGPKFLLRQKQTVECAATALGTSIDVWCVDSGRRFAGQRCGDAVLRLIGDLRRGDTVLVEDMAALGADVEAVAVVAGTMAMLGAAVVAARDFIPFAAVPAVDKARGITRLDSPAFREVCRKPSPTAQVESVLEVCL